MKELVTYTPLQKVLASQLNEIQRRLHNATIGNQSNSLTGMTEGRDNYDFVVQCLNIASGATVKIDQSTDWRQSLVRITYSRLDNATDVIGGGASQAPYVNTHLEQAGSLLLWTGDGADVANVPLDRALKDYYAVDPLSDIHFFSDTAGAMQIRNISIGTRHYLIIVEKIIGLTP